jgi:Fur family zinc uptake transcriptional regulator
LSPNDQRVLDVLESADGPQTAYQILDQLRDAGVRAPTTVYRALDRLVGAGRAHRLESMNAFVCCDGHEHHEATAFAICDDCGAVTEFGEPRVFEPIVTWSRGRGFAVGRMTLELHGRCAGCGES